MNDESCHPARERGGRCCERRRAARHWPRADDPSGRAGHRHEKLAQKCAGLRIFEDAGGKLNVSAEELGCEALVVSNFTLYGDTKKGKRPSFIAAAKPPLSVEAYEAFVAELRKTGLARVETGEFGADMKVTLTNDGPVTIVIDTDEWKR